MKIIEIIKKKLEELELELIAYELSRGHPEIYKDQLEEKQK